MTPVPLPRVLALTMFSGENEYEACQASVREQVDVVIDQVCFENLPNKEAHHALYGEVRRRASEHDVFIKLDADMVFVDRHCAARIASEFGSDPSLDHAIFGVHDWMTDSVQIGVHAFSPRVRWNLTEERMFVDPPPVAPGRTMRVHRPSPPLVRHSPDPSPWQAFHFGAHRAGKALQRGRTRTKPRNALDQLEVLWRVWRHFDEARDRRLGLAIAGAQFIFDRRRPLDDYKGADARSRFQQLEEATASTLHAELVERWSRRRKLLGAWLRAGGGDLVRSSLTGWVRR